MRKMSADPQIMEHNIRGVIDYWTTITQDDLTNFFNALRADAWDEVADNLGEYAEVDDSLIHLADSLRDNNPYRKQEKTR